MDSKPSLTPELNDEPPPASLSRSPGASVASPGGSGGAVVLRYEIATRREARALSYSTWALTGAISVAAIVLLVLRTEPSRANVEPEQHKDWYAAQIGLGSGCLALLLAMAVTAMFGLWRSVRKRLRWRKRQRDFFREAMLLLFLQIGHVSTFLTSYSIALAHMSCVPPWVVIAVLGFFRWTFFSFIMLRLLLSMQAMTLWRGEGALDMQADALLAADRPYWRQGIWQKVAYCVWFLLEVPAALQLAKQIQVATAPVPRNICSSDCVVNTTFVQVAAALLLLMVLAFYCVFVRHTRRALRDHTKLPWARYRDSNIFIRIQGRLMASILIAMLVAVLALEFAGTYKATCFSSFDAQLGDVAVQLALTVAAFNQALLFMPVSELDSPLLNTWLQEFSWTLADLPADRRRRDAHLSPTAAAAAGTTAGQGRKLVRLANAIPQALFSESLFPDDPLSDPDKELSGHPMFCVELAVRCFYWMRFAYLYKVPGAGMREDVALELFKLTHMEEVLDEVTDTRCLVAWGASTVLLAFRGTKTMTNVKTDIKFWRTFHQPTRRHGVVPVLVHSGFYAAWRTNRFSERVLECVAAAVKGADPEAGEQSSKAQPRFVITGHSLGGALACLAAFEVQRAYPTHHICCYTFGSPRVGNTAFAEEYDAAVPDTWAIINRQDPIPRIPAGIGYKRCGERVTINPQGDIIVRPSYFELTLLRKGNTPADHKLAGYALSLAAVFKAQFVATKHLAGGPGGVERLCGAVNLDQALTLEHADLESLRDAEVAPRPEDVMPPAPPKKKTRQQRQGMEGGWWWRLWHRPLSSSNESSVDTSAAAALEDPNDIDEAETAAAALDVPPSQPGELGS